MGGPRRLEWPWRGCAPETKATIVTPSSIPIVHAYPEGIAAWLRPVMPHREVIGLANEAAFVEALPNIEVLVAHLPPRKHWPAAERLRLLHAVGAGVDGLLPAVGLRSEVIVANASGVHIPAMSEWIVAALLLAHKALTGSMRNNAKPCGARCGMHDLSLDRLFASSVSERLGPTLPVCFNPLPCGLWAPGELLRRYPVSPRFSGPTKRSRPCAVRMP